MYTALRTDKNKFLIMELVKETDFCVKPVKIYDFDVASQTYKETSLEGLEAKFDIKEEELKQLATTFEEADLQIRKIIDNRVNFLISREDAIKQNLKDLKVALEQTKKERVILCKKRKK